MEINFFEEFPTEKNLDKVRLVKFPSLLFVAAKSLKEFRKHERHVRGLNKKIELGYWPVLFKEEGYWMSPFSDKGGLERIIDELESEKKRLTVLWNCEFPIHKKTFKLPTKKFFEKKNMITKFLRDTKHHIYTAQPAAVPLFGDFFRFYGLDFPFVRRKIYITYTSMKNKPMKRIYRNIVRMSSLVGLGVIGSEPRLSFEELERDLELAKESDTKEVFIFRLGGLNKRYIKIIEKYIR